MPHLLLLPGQRFTFGDWGYRYDDHRSRLTMGQVGSDGSSEELFEPGPYATAAAADDDHLDIQDVG